MPPFSFKKICPWCMQHEAAQRGEDSDDAKQGVIPAPWVRRGQSTISLTQILFGINIAVFLAMALESGTITSDFPGQVAVSFGANYGPFTLSGQWWRIFTYMFLHGGLWHILFNMWCLWDLGALCEQLYGRWTYLFIYLITGIAGGLTSVAWNPGVMSVGASGAIFGLAGALAASFYLGEFSIPRFALQGTLRSLAFFIGFNVLFGIGYNVFFGGNMGGIDNACHVGGLISGAILGALVARLAPQPDAPARRVSVLAVVALVVLACGFGVREWRGRPMRMAMALSALQKDGADSTAQLRELVRQEPNSAEAHSQLGQVYYSRHQFSDAATEFKRVLELRPESVGAQFNLGMSYFEDKRADDAKSTFTQMIQRNAKSPGGHYGMGLVLANQGQYKAAIDEFKASAADGQSIQGLYYEIGNCYAKLNQYDDAIAAYIKERQQDGDDPDLENALAQAYEAKGMAQQAQEARTKAAQLASGTAQ
jgi:membrane associated rhomboid family serine protease/Flp pilus assembly protein TadD